MSYFHSLSLDPIETMEELYKWVDKYSMLEDNIRATVPTVMITSQPIEGYKKFGKSRRIKGGSGSRLKAIL